MLKAKVLRVVDHDFEHEGFSGCGGVICDAFASAVLGMYGLHLNTFHYNLCEI